MGILLRVRVWGEGGHEAEMLEMRNSKTVASINNQLKLENNSLAMSQSDTNNVGKTLKMAFKSYELLLQNKYVNLNDL